MLNEEIMKSVAALGELVKKNPVIAEAEKAGEVYDSDETIRSLLDEYAILEHGMRDEFDKNGGKKNDTMQSLQERMDKIYELISVNPVYVKYKEAMEEYQEYIEEVFGELQFTITGHRPCSHDCSSCGSDCDHHH